MVHFARLRSRCGKIHSDPNSPRLGSVATDDSLIRLAGNPPTVTPEQRARAGRTTATVFKVLIVTGIFVAGSAALGAVDVSITTIRAGAFALKLIFTGADDAAPVIEIETPVEEETIETEPVIPTRTGPPSGTSPKP